MIVNVKYRYFYGVLAVIVWLIFLWFTAVEKQDWALWLVIPNVWFIFLQNKKTGNPRRTRVSLESKLKDNI